MFLDHKFLDFKIQFHLFPYHDILDIIWFINDIHNFSIVLSNKEERLKKNY